MKQVGGSFLFCMLAFSRLVGAQPSCVPGFKKRFATLTQNDQNKKDTAYLNDGWGFSTKGNYKKADEYYQQALTLAEKNNIDNMLGKVLYNMGSGTMVAGNDSLTFTSVCHLLETKKSHGTTFSIILPI